MSELLTKDEIFSVKDMRVSKVEVPEWGGHVFVRGMTGIERDGWEQAMIEKRGTKREVNMRNARAGLIARTACNEEGVRIFTDADVATLGGKSAAALERVYSEAALLSGVRDEDIDELAEDFSEAAPATSTTA